MLYAATCYGGTDIYFCTVVQNSYQNIEYAKDASSRVAFMVDCFRYNVPPYREAMRALWKLLSQSIGTHIFGQQRTIGHLISKSTRQFQARGYNLAKYIVFNNVPDPAVLAICSPPMVKEHGLPPCHCVRGVSLLAIINSRWSVCIAPCGHVQLHQIWRIQHLLDCEYLVSCTRRTFDACDTFDGVRYWRAVR